MDGERVRPFSPYFHWLMWRMRMNSAVDHRHVGHGEQGADDKLLRPPNNVTRFGGIA